MNQTFYLITSILIQKSLFIDTHIVLIFIFCPAVALRQYGYEYKEIA